MEVAGRRLGLALLRFFPEPGTAVAYLGKGHNAGDALIALSTLRSAGWRIAVRAAFPEIEWASLTRSAFRDLDGVEVLGRLDPEELPRPLVLLDGLVGIGARGPLRPALAELAAEMNALKDTRGAKIAAVDLPSGVDPDSGAISEGAVRADVTFTLGVPKRGLLSSQATPAVGSLALVPLEALPVPSAGKPCLICPQSFSCHTVPRPYEFHKGLAGRVGVLAGSAAYRGAAILAATGALRGGAGLVTLHVPHDLVDRIAVGCPAEVIVRGYECPGELDGLAYDAWVVGPGLGVLDAPASAGLMKLLEQPRIPCVIDADALNAVAAAGTLDRLPEGHVITPHPGEFRRLAPDLCGQSREIAARALTGRCLPVLLLKGARTLVVQGGGELWCNSTGTPGMATGGQGDVLAGVIGALLAAGEPPFEAAARGAWLCGRASEIALSHGQQSEESLLPQDTLAHLGRAFVDWREGTR